MYDATALAADIAAGQKTALQCVQASIEMADRFADYGATVRLEPDLALKGAAAADSVPTEAHGPFHGVPFLAKDLGGYGRGLMPAAGNAALRNLSADPDDDDELFSSFRSVGLIPFGLTTVPEFGLALTSEPTGQPPARNPFDRNLSSGGSSGGAATAVALGITAMAHATDAAGSIRVPAACCGLVGLKASRGRIPGAPHFNNYLMGIASELALSRSVRDTASLFDHVKLREGSSFGPISKVGIAVPSTVSPGTASKMQEVTESCSALGLTVTSVALPEHLGTQSMEIAGSIFAASLASWLASVGLDEGSITPFSQAVLEQGRSMSAVDLFDTHVELVRFGYEAQHLFDDVDAVLMPVLANGPPQLGAFDNLAKDPEARYNQMNALAPTIALANVAGLPALAMPFGMMLDDQEHLPFGFQILGPVGSDERLLNLAASIEAIAPPIEFPYPIAGTA